MGDYNGKFITASNDGSPHAAIAAPTGSGKGVGIVIPNLLNWEESVVVLDIKNENWLKTSGYRFAKLGQNCILFNPLPQPVTKVVTKENGEVEEVEELNDRGNKKYLTHRYNPLDYVSYGGDGATEQTIGDIGNIAGILVPEGKDPMWSKLAKDLLIAIIYLIFERGYPRTMKEVYRIASSDLIPLDERDDPDDERNYLAYLQEEAELTNKPFSDELKKMVSGIAGKPEKTRGSVYSTLQAEIGLWANPLVCLATETSDFDLRKIRQEKTSIYVCTTPPKLAQVRPLLNLFFQQLIALNTEKERDKELNKFTALLLYDEFTSIGKMGIILESVAYMRSYGLRLLPIYQNNEQLSTTYTKDGAATFSANIGLKVNYAPNTLKEAEDLSRELGKKTIKQKSFSYSKGGRSTNVSEIGVSLMTAEEIQRMGDNEIITIEGKKPIFAKKIFWWKNKFFYGRANLPTPRVPNIGNLLSAEQNRFVENLEEEPSSTSTIETKIVEKAGLLNELDAKKETDISLDNLQIKSESVIDDEDIDFTSIFDVGEVEEKKTNSLLDLI